ncbi:MAG TPA: phytanoyl-CoA dioxygenase family protein [Longimicrobium sp.]|nr:phytanoyl-CoA dioxygenase family protein [Longimicrobium sp.]
MCLHYGWPVTGAEWREALASRGPGGFSLRDDPTPGTHPALREVYTSLHALAEWTGENELIIRPGNEPAPWLGPRAPHVDFPVYAPLRTLANNVTYLSDVRERGGAFMYWPGSHNVAWDYFRRNPADYMSRGERSQDQTFALLRRELGCEPVEFVGDAGDLLVWHSLLFHSASVNTRDETRLALFGRWGVALGDEPVYDFDRDMWSYWDFSRAAAAAEAQPASV